MKDINAARLLHASMLDHRAGPDYASPSAGPEKGTVRARRPRFLAVFSSAAFGVFAGFAALVARPLSAQVTVAKFSQDRPGAFCFTFDDALPSQLVYAGPMLDQVGLKGSFYLITKNVIDDNGEKPAMGKPTTWAAWKALAANGHEIGSHTVDHKDLTTLSAADVSLELTESTRVITEKIGIAPVTLAYPYNSRNAAVTKAALQTYIAAREFQNGYGDAAGKATTVAAMNKFADDAVAGKVFRIGMVHGITEPYSSTDPDTFLVHLKHCKQLADGGKLWVATFGEISKYLIEKDSLHLTVKSQSATAAGFIADAKLDSTVFNVPLTFIIAYAGAAPAGVKATRAGSNAPLAAKVEPGRILVQALPGPGLINVDWSPGVTGLLPKAGVDRGLGGARRTGAPRRAYLISGKRLARRARQ